MSDTAHTDERLIERIRAEVAIGTSPGETLRIIKRMVEEDPTLLEADVARIAASASVPMRRARH